MPSKTAHAFIAFLFLSGSPAADALAVDMRPTVTLEMAKRMADACEAKAKQEGWTLSIAVVDAGANLILFRRMADAHLASIDISRDKARSAARMAIPTRGIAGIVYGEDGKGGRAPGLAHVDGLTAFTGGLPIKTDGTLIGAIGTSGATGDQDEDCAQAAIDAIAEDLN